MYNIDMARKLSKERPKCGEHLAELRKAANLSQYDLAKLVGVTQSSIAFWETAEKPPRSDILPKLAKALGVPMETILGTKPVQLNKKGPNGRVRKVFDDVAKLPRRQQDKVIEFVSAFVKQYKGV